MTKEENTSANKPNLQTALESDLDALSSHLRELSLGVHPIGQSLKGFPPECRKQLAGTIESYR